MKVSFLRPTSWLAKRLGLSVSTIERLRAQGSPDLPPHIAIGGSIRYDELAVDEWVRTRIQAATQMPEPSSQGEGDE